MTWQTVQPQPEQPELQSLTIIVVFAVVGPPVGCVVHGVSLGIVGSAISYFAKGDPAAIKLLVKYAEIAVEGTVLSYLVGFVPATLAGVLIAVLRILVTRVRWYAALAVGVCVGIPFSYLFENFITPGRGVPIPQFFIPLLGTFTCAVSTFVCWALVRSRLNSIGAGEQEALSGFRRGMP